MITHCRACQSTALTAILSLGNLALSDFISINKKPPKYPLTLVLCRSCTLVQLKHTVPQSQLYTERYGYKSGMNTTMKEELKEIVWKTQKMITCFHKTYVAVDIGANDGTLLTNYPKGITTVGIEPIKKFAKECRKRSDIVINDFFRYRSYHAKVGNTKAHIVTAISCFYDMEDPNEFLSDAKRILHEHGVLVIQQNYLVDMLKNGAFDNIVHEHLEYYSLLSLENLLSRHNLEVFKVELSGVNGGSFRTYIAHKGQRKVNSAVYLLRKREEKLNLHDRNIYRQFAQRAAQNKKRLQTLMRKLKREHKKIYVYGASTRGNTLLQFFGLTNKTITAAVERNSEKWGKRMSSVGIPIISEEQARREKPDYMLILPWFFRDEFIQREREYLHSGGKFIFPLPRVEIVSK